MKLRILISILLFNCCLFSTIHAENIVLKGTFQGDNIFIKNPLSSSGVGFCIYEVTVNGQTTTDEINSSAFEIDLSVYGFEVGDKVTIEIKTKEGCKATILNPEGISARTTFNIVSIKVENDKLIWNTVNETGSVPFIVEQFRWNKWVKVAEVDGKGEKTQNNYQVTIRPNSGENRFRVKQIDHQKKPRYSDEVKFKSTVPAVSFKSDNSKITFSAATMYEIYDSFGRIMFKGYGAEVKIESLTKGKYFLNYDNKLGQFSKK